MIFPGVDMMLIIIGMAIVAGSYTIIGGLSSVINTEVIQAFVLIIGSTLLAFFAMDSIGGWEVFTERFNDGVWLKLTRPMDDPTVPWLGMWVGIPILGFYFWGNNQVMVQRVLSAKSIDHGRKGVLLVGFLYLFTLFIFIIPGLVARGINLFGVENLPHEMISGSNLKTQYGINTDQVYPRLISKVLPVGLIGIILSAMISALTSALSATLNSVSTLFTMDFYSKINKTASSEKKVKVGKITAVVTLIIAILWAPYIGKFDSLIAYYQEILSYLAPPVVGTFFMGLFWKRANAIGAFSGLMSGLFIAIVIMTLKYIFGIELGLHFLLLAPIILVLSVLTNTIVSLMTAPPPVDKVKENTWTREIWAEETLALKGVVWYKNFRLQALFLVIACFCMYAWFY
jgi:SSS family solute:Na+ symporter